MNVWVTLGVPTYSIYDWALLVSFDGELSMFGALIIQAILYIISNRGYTVVKMQVSSVLFACLLITFQVHSQYNMLVWPLWTKGP